MLDEPGLTTDTMTYVPSGYAEIVHAFDASGRAAGDRFLDLRLCQLGGQACRELCLARADLQLGDAREAEDLSAEVALMGLQNAFQRGEPIHAHALGTHVVGMHAVDGLGSAPVGVGPKVGDEHG